jgi:hypothetical protein
VYHGVAGRFAAGEGIGLDNEQVSDGMFRELFLLEELRSEAQIIKFDHELTAGYEVDRWGPSDIRPPRLEPSVVVCSAWAARAHQGFHHHTLAIETLSVQPYETTKDHARLICITLSL